MVTPIIRGGGRTSRHCSDYCLAGPSDSVRSLRAGSSLHDKACLQDALLLRRNVLFGSHLAVAEEKLLHVLDNDFLVFFAGRVEAVFVQNHLAELGPLLPGSGRNVVVDLLAKFGVEGRLVEAGKLLLELYAKNFVCHVASFIL